MSKLQKNFYVIEGIDGSGKSTCVSLLKNLLGKNSAFFFEPTNKNPFGIQIREILQSQKIISPELNHELLDLFLKDRLWNLENQVMPALQAGKTVVQDRYFFSTAAYQSPDKEKCIDIVTSYLEHPEILQPEKIFFLQITPEIALRRIHARAAIKDVYETKDKLALIADNYDYMWQRFSHFPVIKMDANLTGTEIANQIHSVIKQAIE